MTQNITYRQVTVIEDQILSALEGLKFGSLEITVHDAKIVQLEKKEKLRFGTQKSES